MKRLIPLLLALLLSTGAGAQSLTQWMESAYEGFGGTTSLSYYTTHSYPTPAGGSGMGTNALIKYRFASYGAYVGDWQFSTAYQRTYSPQWSGTAYHSWSNNVEAFLHWNRPALTNGIYFYFLVDSILYYPVSQSLNDTWMSQLFYQEFPM